jgi:D-3-phosphoglycerate dehydrogenase
MNILFLDSVHPLLEQELKLQGFTCDFDYTSDKVQIEAKIAEYNGIVIRSRFKIDKQFLDAATNLKFIARSGAGLENIDVAYAKQKGVQCFHAPEGNRDAVAEHCVGMILSLFNNLKRSDTEVRLGQWNREKNRGYELMGKTIAIIGYGYMGQAFAKRLQGFGVKALAHDKYKSNFTDEFATEASLAEVFEKADIISLHLPQTAETSPYVNSTFLSKFKKPIYVINSARGKNIDTKSLVDGIESGSVLGACLDVLEYESLSFENLKKEDLPEPFQYLTKSEKVVLSPHVAGWTYESYQKLSQTLAHKIKTAFC